MLKLCKLMASQAGDRSVHSLPMSAWPLDAQLMCYCSGGRQERSDTGNCNSAGEGKSMPLTRRPAILQDLHEHACRAWSKSCCDKKTPLHTMCTISQSRLDQLNSRRACYDSLSGTSGNDSVPHLQ